MFCTKENILMMVEGAYKKLKSYYYYDKSLLYMKNKIADFESNDDEFYLTIDEIATNLLNENMNYFDDLISKMDFLVLPKKLISKTKNADVITNNVDHEKDI